MSSWHYSLVWILYFERPEHHLSLRFSDKVDRSPIDHGSNTIVTQSKTFVMLQFSMIRLANIICVWNTLIYALIISVLCYTWLKRWSHLVLMNEVIFKMWFIIYDLKYTDTSLAYSCTFFKWELQTQEIIKVYRMERTRESCVSSFPHRLARSSSE